MSGGALLYAALNFLNEDSVLPAVSHYVMRYHKSIVILFMIVLGVVREYLLENIISCIP